jgi:putative phosphoribosyl transferase
MLPFRDRAEAGRLLGNALAAYAGQADVVVLALPRGGIPVGYAVAKALDTFVVRKAALLEQASTFVA